MTLCIIPNSIDNYVGNFETKSEVRPSGYAREWGRCLSSLAWWLDAICNSVQ